MGEPISKETKQQKKRTYMSLPSCSKDLIRLYTNGTRHPAMKMANNALKMKRSPNQVFLILLGLSGAGKSSTVNYLFKTKLAETGSVKSVTRSTKEYVVQMTSDEWLIENLTMSIIDTPGFDDTDGLEQDAKNIMSIKYFLTRHPNFTNVYPNLIFIAFSIMDNRFEGKGSKFEKMLKGINYLNIVDQNNPNVIVILTHAASIGLNSDKWMKTVLHTKEALKAIVECHLSITPEIVVQENCPEDYLLKKNGDWHILPDGEKQPKVLFESCARILKSSKDEIGHEAVTICFKSVEENIVTVGMSIDSQDVVPADSQMMLDTLMQTIVSPSNSEVGRMLDEYEKTVQNSTNHSEFVILKSKLQGINITTVKDIQRLTMNSLVEKLYPIRISSAMETILGEVFGLKYVQESRLDCQIGSGYNIFVDGKSHKKPIIMIGSGNKYGLPDNVDLKPATTYTFSCQSVQTNEDYINERLKDFNLHLNSKVNYDAFSMKMRSGFTIVKSTSYSKTQHSNELSFAIEQPIYKLSVKEPYKIDPMLRTDIQNLPDCVDVNNEETINTFKSFFAKWGYYAITEMFIGGSISGLVIGKGHTSTEDACEDAKLKLALQLSYLQQNIGFDFGMKDEDKLRSKSTSELSSTSIEWNGGERNLYKNSMDNMNPEEYKSWVCSLEHKPSALWKSLTLYPLHLLAEEVSLEKSKIIQKATNLALTGNFEYVHKQEDNRENVAKSNESGGCFHGESTITLHDGTRKCMRDASVGDLVLTIDKNGFVKQDEIIIWIHKVPEGQFRFLRISHNKGTITITPEHIIFVGGSSVARHASTVIPGEKLQFFKPEGNNRSSNLVTVLSVEEVTGTGIYAPLTLNGRLLVDGVAASCYCTLRPIQVARKTIVSAHSLAHFAFLPLRLARIFGIDVKNKIDRETGISSYAKWLKEKFLQYLP